MDEMPLPPIRPSYQVFMDRMADWMESACYRNDADPRPLGIAAARHLANKPYLREVAPCLAALYFTFVEFDGYTIARCALQFFVWALRHTVYRGRPMWNDFWMCLWQLSRDPRYVGRLYDHLKHATALQLPSAVWMVSSVRQIDSEFNEHWCDILRERGEVF